MIDDTDIRRSIDLYIRRRIREIPFEIKESFIQVSRAWKCDNEIDFLYGYFVGKIEEGTLRYLVKATRSGNYVVDAFDIRNVIETHKKEIHDTIKSSLNSDG